MEVPAEAPAIQIRVKDATQLFNTLDPFPFRDRDLDREAEDFIVGWARELPRKSPIRIVIHLPAAAMEGIQAGEIREALGRYFAYRTEILGLDLKQLFRVGRRSLAIGLAVLAACLFASRMVAGFLGAGEVARFAEEGLVIFGWVANWKPIEIFLYDWWPLAHLRDLYRRLSHATIELRPEAAALS